MRCVVSPGRLAAICLFCSFASPLAAAPTVEQALRLKPIQADVEYDRPSSADAAKCSIRAEKSQGRTGWVVESPQGQLLRQFVDSNGDNVVDQWSYFRDGLEVYRDIDADFNAKADNYRWFHTGGTRWGVDTDEDGRIDHWRILSAEEASAEVVAALRTRDAARFSRLLMTDTELKSLDLATSRGRELSEKLDAARSKFRTLAARQRTVTSGTRFVDFGGTRPGIVPADTAKSGKDLLVYENVDALIETSGKHGQVHVGTLVRMGNLWRLIDLPQFEADGNDARGYFFQSSLARAAAAPASETTGGPNPATQEMMNRLEKLDREIAAAPGSQKSKLNGERTEILQRLADSATESEMRTQWIHQLADTVSAAVQTGDYPAGVARLEALETKLTAARVDEDLRAYVAFRRMSAAYSNSLQAPKADFAKIQSTWLDELEAFVKKYPKSPDSAEAMLQLAIAREFADDDAEALKWYGRIVTTFPRAAAARKAAGARTRIQSIGKSITLRGTTIQGRKFDLARYKGKTVVVQYWATWCEPCKADMARLKELQARYAKRGFAVVGVNLDVDKAELASYLRSNKPAWEHLYEPGGLESRLATEMGILTLPTMLLIDRRGAVVSRNLQVAELETELKKLK